MCIAQAHSLSSYFILPLAWPNSLPYNVPMHRLQLEATLALKPEKQSIM